MTTVTIDSWAAMATLSLALIVIAVVALVATGRVRRRDGWRITLALARYDFWLEWYGVRRRRRRDLRDELRGNLLEAADQVGARSAVGALGPLRELASGAVDRPAGGLDWSNGTLGAVWAGFAVTLAWLGSVFGWLAGAEASGAAQVRGSVPWFPGSHLTLQQGADTFAVTVRPGLLVPVVVVLVTFFVFSRPWRLLGRATAGHPTV